jgi:hypothetical protein
MELTPPRRFWEYDAGETFESFEEAWSGTLAGSFDADAAYAIQAMPGYFEYKSNIEEILRSYLGDSFVVYRSMSARQLDAWKNGNDLGPRSFTFNRILAEAWKNRAVADKAKATVVVAVRVSPEQVLMRGYGPEDEVVIDMNDLDFMDSFVEAFL